MIRKILKSTSQTLTAAWVDYGEEIEVSNKKTIILWPILDINDSEDVRIRGLLRDLATSTNEFDTPNELTESGVTKIKPDYFEFDLDVNQKIPLQWDFDGGVASIQFQIMAGTVGVTPGEITSSSYTMGG